ncbi:MAG: dephospho-CoA kinase [Desulfuromonadaceae bacterium]|jgi:dephospho-CoA kinase
MILGITGGIATGKSSVAKMFQTLGAKLISADDLAREVVVPGTPTLSRLIKRFGSKILLADGSLNRKALASLVFSDARARADLNQIMHPAIAELAERRLQELAHCPKLIVYEAPLLFEAQAEGRVDAVLVVTSDKQQQLQRLMERDQISATAAHSRIAAQMPQSEKIKRADYVMDNSGSLEQLQQQVKALYDRLQSKNLPSPPAS